jgi:predicted nucleotidyltransferase
MERVMAQASTAVESFECQKVPLDVFLDVLSRARDALDQKIPYGLIGGVACAIYGRPRWSYDIDLFVRKTDAGTALDLFAEAGFATDELDPTWIYKAIDRGVLVDVIFRTVGDIYLDDAMIERIRIESFHGVELAVVPPEDLVVIKAIVAKERRPHHWYDALGILARTELDWDYLMHRAGHGVHRVASLLLFAQSIDLPVPPPVIRELLDLPAE